VPVTPPAILERIHAMSLAMSLIFHERVGLDGRRISPFSWRVRYAFAHKGLAPEIIPTRFADVDRIRALSGQDLVPIIQDGAQVVHDSWSIACHLEDRFPDRPSLFGSPTGRGVTRVLNHWTSTVLGVSMRRLIAADFVWCLDPDDRAHYRHTREAQFGMTLEEAGADRDGLLETLSAICQPLERTLTEQPWLAGSTPAYADFIVFSVFQWARIGSPRDILPVDSPLRAWRNRMVNLHDNLADRFGGYPAERAGHDGR
jgi:glutathione S-transferase